MLKPIPGFPQYFADELGTIYSRKKFLYPLKSSITNETEGRGGAYQPYFRERVGYKVKEILPNGRTIYKSRVALVSTWVCLAFHGPRPEGLDCCHKDGNSLNNRADNLYWGTKSENAIDAVMHGTTRTVKLTPQDIQDIRRMLKEGRSHQYIADIKDITTGMVSHINVGRAWNHLPPG